MLRSAGVAGSVTAGRGGAGVRPVAVLTALILASVAAMLAAALVLVDWPTTAAIAAAVAASSLGLAGAWLREGAPPRLTIADAAAERVVDAAILGALAWRALPEDPVTATAALALLVASYLTTYVPVKATGLGLPLAEPVILRTVRVALVAVGLVQPVILDPALWVASGLAILSLGRHVAAIARRRDDR